MERHFCVTTHLFDKNTKKFVLIRHKKLQKWFSPGGHIEPNENPTDAARREVQEETGIDNITFIIPKSDVTGITNLQIQPFGIQANIIKENHEHLDLIYLATTDRADLVLNERETEAVKEFSIEEIMDKDFDTNDNQKNWCKYFYNYLNK